MTSTEALPRASVTPFLVGYALIRRIGLNKQGTIVGRRPHRCSPLIRFLTTIVTLLLLSVGDRPAGAQTTRDEHTQHHPATNATPATPGSHPAPPAGILGTPGTPSSGATSAEMVEMMKQMGAPPPMELYPSLMALPDEVTAEQR